MALNFLNNGYFAGNVGIGTETPNQKLHVQGGGVRIEDVGTGAFAYSQVRKHFKMALELF